MEKIQLATASDEYGFHRLALTRGVLLEHLFASQVAPQDVLQQARGYNAVTHWEELLCAVINPEAGRLMAVVTIHQPDGYSGIFRRHGSIEYVRFFLDWEDGEGCQPVSLAHFRVSDVTCDDGETQRPRYWLVSTSFDRERYWGSLLNGTRPRVKAVLSWNQVPGLDHSFTPLFGNSVESRVCVDSEVELMGLFRHQQLDDKGKHDLVQLLQGDSAGSTLQ
ncbi:MAG: hypothetical protein P8178_08085 [Candidatus Thiodiazotropha sp.]